MTSITRQQLRDAIEAGIVAASAAHKSFADDHAQALRDVAERAPMVARGTFMAPCSDGGRVPCPVAMAFPDWPGQFDWDLTFADAYDGVSYWAFYSAQGRMPGNVLRITDNDDSTEGGA